MASSWCPTSRLAASTSSPPRWFPSSKSAAITAATTPAPRCAITSTCPRSARGPAEPNGRRGVSSARVPLDVLDLVPISSGSSAAEALRNTIDLAGRAEELGYRRYWFAEHHLNPGVAGTSPALLIAIVAGHHPDHPSGLRRRAERSSHGSVGGRGVRADRRALSRPDRPGPRPLGWAELHAGPAVGSGPDGLTAGASGPPQPALHRQRPVDP